MSQHTLFSLLFLALCLFLSTGEARRKFYPLADEKHMRHERRIDLEAVNRMKAKMNSPDHKEDDDNPFKYSGYFETNKTVGAHLYYVFFPAQNGDKDAPVMLWLNGGPGCSSLDGAFDETLSPYSISDSYQLVKNKYSWSKRYSMLFIDQPWNTGFSYTEKTAYVHNMDEVANNLYSALTSFFSKYSEYKNNDFYITGESFAGNYVPSIAYKIQQEGFAIPLKGIAIGDGLTHPDIQMAKYSDTAYANSLVDENGLAAMQKHEQEVRDAIKNKEYSRAENCWGKVLQVVSEQSDINLYDIRLFGSYNNSKLTHFLNLPHVQKQMHTEGHQWELCDGPVYEHLASAMPVSQQYKVVSLLNSGSIRVLLYNGLMDLIIPTSGAQEWISAMDWKGKDGYNSTPRKLWKVDDKTAGYVRQYKTLTQLAFRGAGHMVPRDRSRWSGIMIDRFLVGQ